MAGDTLADLIAPDAPPDRHDPIWNRLRLSLANVDPLPPALEPALTLVAFQLTMAQKDKGRLGGFEDFYTLARNKAQAPRLAADLDAFGLPEAAQIAREARALFNCSDDALYDQARFYQDAEESPIFPELRRLSDAAFGEDYEGAAWRALKAGADDAAGIPASSGKRGFMGWLLSK